MIRITDLSVSFGAVQAVDGVSLEIGTGEIFGLVGPNGSGKSTLLNALSGLVPASGRVEFDGEDLPLGRPLDCTRRGIARTFQTPQPYGELTCAENVLLGFRERSYTGIVGAWVARRRMWRAERPRWDDTATVLAERNILGVADMPADQLSYGQRRFLELARVFAMRPHAVFLDEPAAGLNDVETAELADSITALGDSGALVVVVEHKIEFINAVCHRVGVLDQGRLIALGAPADVWRDDAVAAAYLGIE